MRVPQNHQPPPPPQGARQAWQAMRDAHVQPNVYTYNALMAACGRAGDVEALEAVWAEMVAAGLQPSVASHTVVLDAYGRQVCAVESAFFSSSKAPAFLEAKFQSFGSRLSRFGVAQSAPCVDWTNANSCLCFFFQERGKTT